ncbi:RNA polymerase sigma factor [Marilutibacter alkalisoli]|uniref:RNA polymerase sigma factor n=1 Tax=Marilutibacter alkalisoli TaxID=2591633 RepID=A0A514BQN4_9GAMM|nr:RNA polymerase sigma factor [Lysobacter alkalisoli]QDH69681.1 RNA polymerase sigma factor [Lysobacter alkalisoli]
MNAVLAANAPAQDIDSLIHAHLPAARRGDHDAYARIVAACQNSITAIALAIVRDVPTSEDIAQEAFLKAWQGLDTLKNHASFLPWLRQIARNLARDYLRAARHRPMTGEGADVAINMAADPAPSPTEKLLRTEEELVATEIISALPDDSREALLLYYREGQRSKQVAELLGLSDDAVRKRLSRARAQVRDEMLARFGEFARTTAPGSAFTAMVVGMLAMSSPAVGAAAVIGSGVLGAGAGKLGSSGLVGTGVSGGVAGGSAGLLLEKLLESPQALGGLAFGVIAGTIGFVYTYIYLCRFAGNEDERRRISRFMTINSLSGAIWLVAILLASTSPHWLPFTAAFAIGFIVINYQYLGPLQQLMAPMLARPENQHRVRCYQYMVGRKAVAYASLFTLAVMVYALFSSGRITL